jgi:hypothetical protein
VYASRGGVDASVIHSPCGGVSRETLQVMSVAVAVMAYLLLLRLRANQIKPGSSWSAFTLKQELAWEGGTHHLHRTVRQEARKEIRRQRAAEPPPLRLAA